MEVQKIEVEECVRKQQEQRSAVLEQARGTLQKKYGVEMTVFRMWKQSIVDEDYWIEAAARDSEDVRFLAQVSGDGTCVKDQYTSRLLSQKIENIVVDTLKERFQVFTVKIGLGDKWSEKADVDQRLKNLCTGKASIRGMLYLDILEEQGCHYSPEQIYAALVEVAQKLLFFSGQLMVSVLPMETFSKILVYLREHANVDDIYKQLKRGYDRNLYPFSKGRFETERSQFVSSYRR